MNEELLIHSTQCRALHINSIYSLKLLETKIGGIGTFLLMHPQFGYGGRAQAHTCTHVHVYVCVEILMMKREILSEGIFII